MAAKKAKPTFKGTVKKAAASASKAPARAAQPAKKGMGFKAAAASVQKREGVSADAAAAIIAAGARKASPAAKKANPNLKKVKGK